MKTITSRQNPEIMAIATLGDAKSRNQQGLFIAEGIRTIAQLIKSPLKLVQIYATQTMYDKAVESSHHNKVTLVNDHVIEKISQSSTPSGIVAVFRIPLVSDLDYLTSGLVLARVSDPGNMGTLIRTAAALNMRTIVIVEGADVWSPKVVQASAGTLGMIDIYKASWEELAAITAKKSLNLCALVVSGGQKPEVITDNKTLLVIGNEAHGIPAEWLHNCPTQITIPMPGSTESLNAAVAGSIAMYLMCGTSVK